MHDAGINARVIENCLNGRRTAWPDPFKSGRDGSEGLSEAIEMNSPLKLVILMLGTNDFQCTHNHNAWLSAQGTAKLVRIIRQSPIEPGMNFSEIIIVVPPEITEPKGYIADKFNGSEKRCVGLAQELKNVASDLDTMYFDAGAVVNASSVDGIHLDQPDHEALGLALAEFVIARKLF